MVNQSRHESTDRSLYYKWWTIIKNRRISREASEKIHFVFKGWCWIYNMSHDHVGIYFFISCDRTKKKKKKIKKNGRKEKRETYSNPSLAAAAAWTFFWFCCSRGGVCSGKDLFLTIESLSHHHPFRFSIWFFFSSCSILSCSWWGLFISSFVALWLSSSPSVEFPSPSRTSTISGQIVLHTNIHGGWIGNGRKENVEINECVHSIPLQN